MNVNTTNNLGHMNKVSNLIGALNKSRNIILKHLNKTGNSIFFAKLCFFNKIMKVGNLHKVKGTMNIKAKIPINISNRRNNKDWIIFQSKLWVVQYLLERAENPRTYYKLSFILSNFLFVINKLKIFIKLSNRQIFRANFQNLKV